MKPNPKDEQSAIRDEYGMRPLRRVQVLLTGALVLSAGGLMAQEFPNRVVRIVVADTPGSNPDIVMRFMAQKLSEAKATS